MAASAGPWRFTAAIRKQGMNYCVDVPEAAGRALAGEPPERHPRVAGRAGGVAFRTRLTPRGGGAWRLFLNGEARAAAGAGEGDAIAVELRRETAPREPEPPADLREALAAAAGGLEAFASLTAAQREGMSAFVERARTPSTRARYVARAVAEALRRAGG